MDTRAEYERRYTLPVSLELCGTLEGVLALGAALAMAQERGDWSLADVRDREPSPGSPGRDCRIRVMRQWIDRVFSLRRERAERRATETPSLRERCFSWLRRLVHAEYNRCEYRVCACGHEVRHALSVDPHAASSTSLGDSYSRRCTYRKRSSKHTITIRGDWRQTVLLPGLSIYKDNHRENRLVLAAKPVPAPANYNEAYSLLYAAQGAGTSLVDTRGYCVRRTGPQGWITGYGGTLVAAQRDCAWKWRQYRESEHRRDFALAEAFWAAWCAAVPTQRGDGHDLRRGA